MPKEMYVLCKHILNIGLHCVYKRTKENKMHYQFDLRENGNDQLQYCSHLIATILLFPFILSGLCSCSIIKRL